MKDLDIKKSILEAQLFIGENSGLVKQFNRKENLKQIHNRYLKK
ncbi:hypothetical protein [Kaistella flava (ex Peng et al. 2021)]|nr:hypothetical protein [Kaistella flava (ex Peng et al. 2021)]